MLCDGRPWSVGAYRMVEQGRQWIYFAKWTGKVLDPTISLILPSLRLIILPFSTFQLHAQVIKTNYEKSSSVGTALLDAYVKMGCIDEAAKVFELIDEKDIVAWSAMVAGYAQR